MTGLVLPLQDFFYDYFLIDVIEEDAFLKWPWKRICYTIFLEKEKLFFKC